MENSPLNKAHQQDRKAEALLRHKKFEDCIECHKKAVEFLTDACKMTENVRSLESLQLQKEYHQKQIDVVLMKKMQHEHYIRTIESEIRKISFLKIDLGKQNGDHSLEALFLKTFQVHDSLIDYLGKRGTGSDNDSLKSYSTSDTDEKIEKDGTIQFVGNKHPKDESQIIEELKVLSGQLRDTVQCLLVELDDRNNEIQKLKTRIQVLENEKEKAQSKNHSSLKVVTDSSGGTSPYVFSPCSEFSPDVINETGILPPLAPLEMPSFDFLSLIKSNNNNNKN